jgi:hypothetical protein
MEPTAGFVIPDILPYMFAILCLLILWQYHQLQVMQGRIQAIDIFDRSGIRLYIHVVPNDESTCEVCRQAFGRVFLPSDVIKKDFSPLESPCTNPAGCKGVLVGLYGAWTEARQLIERLRTAKKKVGVQLSGKELTTLVHGPWERSISAATDRIAVHVLEAMLYEHDNPETSIMSYRYLIDQAKEVRHLPYVIPSYFRLVELLAKQGRTEEVIELIDQFEVRYKSKKSSPHSPTEKQFGLMSIKKSKLKTGLKKAS